MNYFALQVKTSSEDIFIKRVLQALGPVPEDTIRLIFPKRKMHVRKAGISKNQIEPVFPGYIFLETEKLDRPLYWTIRTTPGFFRFLPDNQEPKPLDGRDLSTLKHFTSFGEVADKSKVLFDADDRIQVVEGPLKGLEGRIVKVDKRKGRAKVKLDMYDESFLIDLSFEVIGQQ